MGENGHDRYSGVASDTVDICIEPGASVGAAIRRVGEELRASALALGYNLTRCRASVGLAKDYDDTASVAFRGIHGDQVRYELFRRLGRSEA